MALITKELAINCALIYVSYYSEFRRTMVSSKEIDGYKRAIENDVDFKKAFGIFSLGEDAENIYFTSLAMDGNYYYILKPDLDFEKVRNDILGRVKYLPIFKTLRKNEVLLQIGLSKENDVIRWFA